MGHKARCFLKELARRISLATEDNQAHSHPIQHLSMAVQRGNAAAVLGCIGVGMGCDFRSISILLRYIYSFILFIFIYCIYYYITALATIIIILLLKK